MVALDQAEAHDVVHAAVATELAGQFPLTLPERVLVLLVDLGADKVLAAFLTLDIEARRVVHEDSPAPLNDVQAGVGARQRDRVLEDNRAALRGLDQAGVHVAAGVGFLALGAIRRDVGVAVLGEANGLAAHGDEAGEPVAFVDIHVLRHRAKAVGGVEVAVALDMRDASPEPLAGVREQQAAQVVVVGRLAVHQLPKEPLLAHIEHHTLGVAVAAVL